MTGAKKHCCIAAACLLVTLAPCWPALASGQQAMLCDSMASDDRASCESALELLVKGGPGGSGAIHAVASARKWVFLYQTADAKPSCAILVDHLVLPSDRQTRLFYTSNNQMLELDIAELGIRKTAFPGRVSDATIDGARFSAKAEQPTDAGSANGVGIRVDFLQPAAYSAWETGFKQECASEGPSGGVK